MALSGFVFNDELHLLEDCLALTWRYMINEASEHRSGDSFRMILKLRADIGKFDTFVDYYRQVFNPNAKARNYEDVAFSFAGKTREQITEIIMIKYEAFREGIEQALLFNHDVPEESRRIGRYASVMDKIYNCTIALLKKSPIVNYDMDGWVRELSDDTM